MTDSEEFKAQPAQVITIVQAQPGWFKVCWDESGKPVAGNAIIAWAVRCYYDESVSEGPLFESHSIDAHGDNCAVVIDPQGRVIDNAEGNACAYDSLDTYAKAERLSRLKVVE
jgi:hypothetical protein